MRWRQRFSQFMVGRYGVDQLNRAMLITSLVLMVLSWFGLRTVFYTIGLVLLILCNIRMFSRNFQARYKENTVYVNQINKIRYFISKLKYKKNTSKTHHIYSCPTCKQKIRVPRGKGKIMIHCPKCHTEFMKKS